MNEATPARDPRPSRDSGLAFFEWLPWEKITIWALFLGAVYLLRHFFFIILMTFLICSALRWAIVRIARIVSPHAELPWLERLLAVVGFLLLLGVLIGAGNYIVPRIITQGQELVGRISRLDPEHEFRRGLTATVGRYLFRLKFGDRSDKRYQEEFEKFRSEGLRGLTFYQQFPSLQATLEAGFETKFDEEQTHKIRMELIREGIPQKGFDEWLLKEKASELTAPDLPLPVRAPSSLPADPLERQRILDEIKKTRATLSRFESEWRDLMVAKKVADLRNTPIYHEHFKEYYDQRRKENPEAIPYDYVQYQHLKDAYPKGVKAFSAALGQMKKGTDKEEEQQLYGDFESSTRQELSDRWWEESPAAAVIRSKVNDSLNDFYLTLAGWIRDGIAYCVTIPLQLATALLLSFFILIDFPNLKRGVQTVRESRMREFYEEIAPGLISFGRLIAKSFYAQGVVSLFNTAVIFVALTWLGVEHAMLFAAMVFVCCFIPVVGVVLSGFPIVAMALLQPGGSLWLGVKVVIAILATHLIEVAVIDPRVFGRMMHMHPVLILVVLAVAEHFFGIWGLILGVPVAVYIISVLMLDDEPDAPDKPTSAASLAT